MSSIISKQGCLHHFIWNCERTGRRISQSIRNPGVLTMTKAENQEQLMDCSLRSFVKQETARKPNPDKFPPIVYNTIQTKNDIKFLLVSCRLSWHARWRWKPPLSLVCIKWWAP
jgi:hypothetical protein